MITEAIILAGGRGTRLQNAVPGLPKCLAPVAGQPFLHYVLQYLAGGGIKHFVLATGYKAALIKEYVQTHYSSWNISFSEEQTPLGTGGAIVKALSKVNSPYVLITNGDTLYKAVIQKAFPILENSQAECILFLKQMADASRYGLVKTTAEGSIEAFEEKKSGSNGLINGGIYALNISLFLQRHFPPVFSFEKDYLQMAAGQHKLYGIPDDAYFIDIGIPEDYKRAGRELPE